jgi:hypothetical protein
MLDSYRDDEASAGRSVPTYSFEAMAGLVAGWLLKKAGDEIFKRIMEYRKTKGEVERRIAQQEREEQRHRELLAKLDELVPQDMDSVELSNPGSYQRLPAVLEHIARSGIRITIVVDSDAENDLLATLREMVKIHESISLVANQVPD